MTFIRSVVVPPDRMGDGWPWTLPAVAALTRGLELDPAVTVLAGENGSGKSTLLEAIAVAAGFAPEGGSEGFGAHAHDERPVLADALRLVRSGDRPRTGFFLRAESFFGVMTEIDRQEEEREGMLAAYGGRSLHERSHGEGFLALALHRFRARGLYLLDEPESALSVQSCLALLARMRQLVDEGSQFLLATHSPVLMAYPRARILELGGHGISPVAYEDVEAVRLTRTFLADPDRMLRLLMEG